MGYFDYSREPKSDIAFVDMKSFYASVECVKRGLHPLKTSLCVMSRADNSTGLILASSPMFKKILASQMLVGPNDLPLISRPANSSTIMLESKGCLLIQTMFATSKIGPSDLDCATQGWTSTSQSIWKSSESFKTMAVQMIFIPTLSMRALLT